MDEQQLSLLKHLRGRKCYSNYCLESGIKQSIARHMCSTFLQVAFSSRVCSATRSPSSVSLLLGSASRSTGHRFTLRGCASKCMQKCLTPPLPDSGHFRWFVHTK